MPWPGTAGVTVSVVILNKGQWSGLASLDGQTVNTISSFLEGDQNFTTPFALANSHALASTGTSLNGEGFIVSPAEYEVMISKDKKNKDVLMPYLVADDLNTLPSQNASRYAINFGELDEAVASEYELPMKRVRELVKPARDKLTKQIHEVCYWKHWDKRPALYQTLKSLKFALVAGRVTKHVTFSRINTGQLFSDRLIVVTSDRFDLLSVLQSTLHSTWVEQLQTSMGETIGYSVSKCYTTFPWPQLNENKSGAQLESVGARYDSKRREIMVARKEGLTKTYNRFHDPDEQSEDIARLRALHVEMDQAVAAAYGWSDLDLGHGFHATKQGERYTLSESARRTVLDKLLELNHQRYAEEVAAGLHDKGAKKPKGKKSKSSNPEPTLF